MSHINTWDGVPHLIFVIFSPKCTFWAHFLKISQKFPKFLHLTIFLHKYNLWYLWIIWALDDDDDQYDDHDDDDLGAEFIRQPASSARPSSISTTWKPEKVKLFLLKYVDMILNLSYVGLDRCSKERSSWNVDGWSSNCGFSAWHDFELFVCLSWLLFIRKKFLKWQSAEVEITITVFQLEIVPKPVALWLQARDVLALGKEYLFFFNFLFFWYWVNIFSTFL